ncbi:hypothetical protein A0257_20455 [Hymenobacter psoromatis]|nr:hypothetical protein A0257_20455 [Hymenobacter psoromatis]
MLIILFNFLNRFSYVFIILGYLINIGDIFNSNFFRNYLFIKNKTKISICNHREKKFLWVLKVIRYFY